jgi:prepilin-type N-terminal cleavage/methylation domain-containing protein
MHRAVRPPTVPATDFQPGTNVRWPAGASLKQAAGRVDPLPVESGFGDRARRRALSERGFTLIEVLMTSLLVTLISAAVAGALMTNIHATAAQHRQTAAQALAEQDQERLKGLSSEQLDNLQQTYNATFDNYKFQVTSQAWYLSSSNSAACSTAGGANATYFKTISTVAWTNTSNVNETLASDEGIISPPAGGGILTQFHDQTTSPLSGVAVNATGPAAYAGTSDSNGCVIFSALPTGSYNLKFTDTGYVDPNGNASPISTNANVASTGFAAPSTGNPVELGQGGGITGNFAVQYPVGGTAYVDKADALSWLSPGGAGIPMANYRTNASGLANSIQTTYASGAIGQGLFPFVSSLNPVSYTNNYQVWAGKCLQEEPPAGNDMFTVMPGSSGPQNILEPALVLTASYKAQNGTVSPITPTDVKATFTSAAGSGTSCTDEWGPTPVAKNVSSGVNAYGIPFASGSTTGSGSSSSGQTGSVTVCADWQVGSSYYNASTPAFTDSYTSTTPETLQIKWSSSAPGACP